MVTPKSADEVIAAVVAAGLGRPVTPRVPGTRPAAVLVGVADGPLGAQVLLTRRTMNLSTHKGEVSFPGGRIEPGESAVEAALREAHEEVGLAPTSAEVAGELDHLSAVAYPSYIVPVVAKLDAHAPLVPSAAEVDRIFWAPLTELAHAEAYREEWWVLDADERAMYFFELVGDTVWGATGRMVHQLLSIAYGASVRVSAPL